MRCDILGERFYEDHCSFRDRFANCLETRRSVGCHFVTVGGCLVDYSMTKHNTVSDSTTEGEDKELSKTSKSTNSF